MNNIYSPPKGLNNTYVDSPPKGLKEPPKGLNNIYVDSPPKGLKKPPKGLDSPPKEPKKEPKKTKKGLEERPKGLEEPNKEKFIKWYIKNNKKPGDTDAETRIYAEDAWDLEDPDWEPKKIKHETKKEFENRQLKPPHWNNENNDNDKIYEFMNEVTGGPKTNGGYKRTRRTKRNKRNTRKRFKRK